MFREIGVSLAPRRVCTWISLRGAIRCLPGGWKWVYGFATSGETFGLGRPPSYLTLRRKGETTASLRFVSSAGDQQWRRKFILRVELLPDKRQIRGRLRAFDGIERRKAFPAYSINGTANFAYRQWCNKKNDIPNATVSRELPMAATLFATTFVKKNISPKRERIEL